MTSSSTTPPSPPQVLVFAASDPSSGAGIQADILTLASLGCHPLTAITALTVQDTVGVQSVHPVSAELLEQQARTILEDMPVAAFKSASWAVSKMCWRWPKSPRIIRKFR
jgi:hydroxymethylpyrimidine/phosphomethylpyrimidine kinase